MKKLFRRKNIKFILLIVVILIAISFYLPNLKNTPSMPIDSENWQPYRSTKGNFIISMPSGVTETSTSSAIAQVGDSGTTEQLINYNSIDSEKNVYLASVEIYPYMLNTSSSALITDADVLKKQKSNWTTIAENTSKLKGYQTYDLLFKQGDQYLKYRFFSIYKYQYLIGMASTNKNFPLFEKFANSFELIDKNLGPKDISFLQDYIKSAQTSKNYWEKAYLTGKYSKQDLDRITDLASKMISSCQVIIANLQSENVNYNNNTVIWNSIMNMTDEHEKLYIKLNGK
ncbi:MAG: hypothetical protein Q7K55_06455 [Candidatus Levybacteria bacterium]|nr:hypothetical protein [Candidatus Levybacteria bacterium]